MFSNQQRHIDQKRSMFFLLMFCLNLLFLVVTLPFNATLSWPKLIEASVLWARPLSRTHLEIMCLEDRAIGYNWSSFVCICFICLDLFCIVFDFVWMCIYNYIYIYIILRKKKCIFGAWFPCRYWSKLVAPRKAQVVDAKEGGFHCICGDRESKVGSCGCFQLMVAMIDKSIII